MPASASDALAEAYASAPVDEFVISGLELMHPMFVDEEENPDSIRVALDDRAWDLPHEDTARMHAGEIVTYAPLSLRVVEPSQEEGQFGQLRVALDNVPRTILPQIERASEVRAAAILVYREWVLTQDTETKEFSVPDAPDRIIGELSVKRVQTRMLTMEATAEFIDLLNRSFPTGVFDRERFAGLFGG